MLPKDERTATPSSHYYFFIISAQRDIAMRLLPKYYLYIEERHLFRSHSFYIHFHHVHGLISPWPLHHQCMISGKGSCIFLVEKSPTICLTCDNSLHHLICSSKRLSNQDTKLLFFLFALIYKLSSTYSKLRICWLSDKLLIWINCYSSGVVCLWL